MHLKRQSWLAILHPNIVLVSNRSMINQLVMYQVNDIYIFWVQDNLLILLFFWPGPGQYYVEKTHVDTAHKYTFGQKSVINKTDHVPGNINSQLVPVWII